MKVRARRRQGQLALLLAALFALLQPACGGDSTGTPAPATPTGGIPTATPTPTPPPIPTATPTPIEVVTATLSPASAHPGRAHPPTTRTGIAQVDAVLDAIEGGEGVDLLELMTVDRLPCAAESTAAAPACPSGFAPGDVIAAFRGGACEPQFYVGRSIADLAGSFVAAAPNLYAVYRDSPGSAYGIVFAERRDGTGTASSVIVGDDGGVRAVHVGHCGAGPADWLNSPAIIGSVVFPPAPG